MALRLAMRDEGFRQLADVAYNKSETEDRRMRACDALCRRGYGALETHVLVDVVNDSGESEPIRFCAASCLCYVVSQFRLALRFSEDKGAEFPGLAALTTLAHDRSAPFRLPALALQALICSWREQDFATAAAPIADPEKDEEFRGEALSLLPKFIKNPLPTWLCHFSPVQRVQDLSFREGTGDEEARRRWDHICDLVGSSCTPTASR
jgi:hypothetical protein